MPPALHSMRSWSVSEIALLLAIATVALALRLGGLLTWPLDGDEFFTFAHSAERSTGLLNPAYYQLVELSASMIGRSDLATRIPAFIFGAAAIPALYLCWRRELGARYALLASTFLALSSWHIFLSQYARFYSGVIFFAILSQYAYVRTVRTNRASWLVASIGFAAVAALFHVTGALILAGTFTSSLAILLLRKRANQKLPVVLVLHVGAFIMAGVLLTPVAWQVLHNWQATGQSWGYGPALILLQCAKYFGFVLSLAALIGLWPTVRRDQELGVALGISAAVPLLLLLPASAFMAVRPDYVAVALPVITLLAAEFVRAFSSRQKASCIAIAIVILAAQLPEVASEYMGRRSLNVRDVAQVLDDHYKPGDRVLSFFPGVDHYSRNDLSLEPYPGNPTDDGIDWQSALDTYADGKDTLWVAVNRSRAALAPGLEAWLLRNGELVWRETSARIDSTVSGYEIFRVNAGRSAESTQP